jgi:putative transposase
VHDDTRPLRRMLAKDRAKILFATVSHHAGRRWISLNAEAANLHPVQQHTPRDATDHSGWVGVDRGSSAFAVVANDDGKEVARITNAPKALAAGMKRQRRLAKSLSRKQKGSRYHRDAVAKLGRHHHHVANVRRHFLHQVSNALVKNHDRLVLEDLNVTGCWPTITSPAPSPMRAGPSSPANWATNRPGAAANSLSRIAGIPRASYARPAVPSTAI